MVKKPQWNANTLLLLSLWLSHLGALIVEKVVMRRPLSRMMRNSTLACTLIQRTTEEHVVSRRLRMAGKVRFADRLLKGLLGSRPRLTSRTLPSVVGVATSDRKFKHNNRYLHSGQSFPAHSPCAGLLNRHVKHLHYELTALQVSLPSLSPPPLPSLPPF